MQRRRQNKMVKIILVISLLLNTCIWAKKSESKEAKIKRIRKELKIDPPTKYELKVIRMRKELGIEDDSNKEQRIDSIRDELRIGYKKPEKESELDKAVNKVTDPFRSDTSVGDDLSFGNALTSVKKKLHLEKEKKDEDFSFSGTLNDFYDTVGLEKGESWGLPAFYGFNEKKKKSRFGTKIFGDIGDTGQMMFKGMKYSGTSAEFTSGMMYRSSKMYNTMFGMFEESPFNVFEDEDETSIFDVFEGGNTVLDIFD